MDLFHMFSSYSITWACLVILNKVSSIVLIRMRQIIFIDFATPVPPVINNLRDSLGTFFFQFVSLTFYSSPTCTSLNISCCCLFRVNEKLLSSSLEISGSLLASVIWAVKELSYSLFSDSLSSEDSCCWSLWKCFSWFCNFISVNKLSVNSLFCSNIYIQ